MNQQPIGPATDFEGAQTPEPTVLDGAAVRLEPLSAHHAEAIYTNLGAQPELWTYRSDDPPESVQDVARRIARDASSTDRLTWAVVPLQGGAQECHGMMSLMRIQPELGTIEVGSVIFGPKLQRTRAATEAQYVLMRYVFDLGYRRYEWKCDSLNQPSRDAALRLGFVEEGTWRKALVYKGRNRDTTWFSIIDDEWSAVRDALEAWLADDNHRSASPGSDLSGTQLRPLAEFRISRLRKEES